MEKIGSLPAREKVSERESRVKIRPPWLCPFPLRAKHPRATVGNEEVTTVKMDEPKLDTIG